MGGIVGGIMGKKKSAPPPPPPPAAKPEVEKKTKSTLEATSQYKKQKVLAGRGRSNLLRSGSEGGSSTRGGINITG